MRDVERRVRVRGDNGQQPGFVTPRPSLAPLYASYACGPPMLCCIGNTVYACHSFNVFLNIEQARPDSGARQ